MRLLLVEDEIGLAAAVEKILVKENYIVDVANNGQDALDCALTGIYDGIILDIMIPKIDGIEVLKLIRQNKIQTPVLLLTAKAELEDKIEGLDAGADDYLTKPFHGGELLARVRAVTRRKGNIISSEITFGDLTLNKQTLEIKCGKSAVKLGAKEYYLMELLISNAGQIITKEQITEKIWGYDSEAEYNNVEVYISFLRKKLVFIGSKVQIKAKRGIGYILEF